uniref:Uncharacterized protein n=1 Tax=Romanomermis culicivorax TaxID=13658 RepID=A0A915HL37_ROMCU
MPHMTPEKGFIEELKTTLVFDDNISNSVAAKAAPQKTLGTILHVSIILFCLSNLIWAALLINRCKKYRGTQIRIEQIRRDVIKTDAHVTLEENLPNVAHESESELAFDNYSFVENGHTNRYRQI